MDDYRYMAALSPIVWCYRCKKIVEVDDFIAIMKTIYNVTPDGVYPWGLCCRHQCPNIDSKVRKSPIERIPEK